jgi:HAE1 family hydrophobic/amphiphilic exporter-1
MTTFAALVGTLPIAVGWGAGGESRQPLGLAVVGGLLFSQMLTLFVTPVFYLYMDTLQKKLRSTFGAVKVEAARQAQNQNIS